jgi:FtsP/CotA-like multicopper oxidase with cupredoxin domain
MATESEQHADNPWRASLSRRDFLRRGALGSAYLTPGIVLLSAVTRRPAAAAQSGAAAQLGVENLPVAEYELSVANREAEPDGRSRRISCYNGQLPGPLIRARLGQKLRIKVVNHLSTPTSVHWHGLHQPGTWQMDGVDQVSHAPIPPGETFVYEFTATPAGTHWYHSHVGVQYGNGLFGPLVIDEPAPPAKYDREEILLINDWFLRPAEKILAGLLAPMQPGGAKMGPMQPGRSDRPMAKTSNQSPTPTLQGMPMKGMTMKGMTGKPDVGDVPFESALFNGRGRFAGTRAPLARLRVKRGETLRLRLINASSTYAFRFQIDGHPLTVIATDGSPVVPIQVDNLVFGPGERYDVLLTADQSRAAWIRAATLAGDEARAILDYSDTPNGEPAGAPVMWGKRSLALDALRSPSPVNLGLHPREVLLRLGGTMRPYAWNVNDEYYPHAQPITAAKDEWLRFVLDNPTGMDHPFHLHGHYFYVLGAPDHLNLVDPPRKDTVNVPAGRQLVLVWKANNPGHWFFHCHIEWHVATGMARVIQIAEH